MRLIKEKTVKLNRFFSENIGETVIFQWVEKVRELLRHMQVLEAPEEGGGGCDEVVSVCPVDQHIVMPTIIHGSVITDRKSVFQGHIAIVKNTEHVS
jgi:hypothetical protein